MRLRSALHHSRTVFVTVRGEWGKTFEIQALKKSVEHQFRDYLDYTNSELAEDGINEFTFNVSGIPEERRLDIIIN